MSPPEQLATLLSRTDPIDNRKGLHAVRARTAVALLDALGITRAP